MISTHTNVPIAKGRNASKIDRRPTGATKGIGSATSFFGSKLSSALEKSNPDDLRRFCRLDLDPGESAKQFGGQFFAYGRVGRFLAIWESIRLVKSAPFLLDGLIG